MAVGGPKNSRGRPYGMMLLLAFGAAILGVLVLHKLRERRLFNLLIKDKDQELIALQLLLQKERDSSKEVKRKLEETKGKVITLRTQKMDLNSKLMEVQSMLASFKEEQQALEATIDEKDNRIRLLAENEMEHVNDDNQLTALTQLLKQKEAEIEEMKLRLEKTSNIWSVSTDDPSKLPLNPTTKGVILQKNYIPRNDGKEEGTASGEGQLATNSDTQNTRALTKKGDNDTRNVKAYQTLVEVHNQEGEGWTERGRTRSGDVGEEQRKRETREQAQFDKLTDSRKDEDSTKRGENGIENTRERKDQGEILKYGKLEMPSRDGEGFASEVMRDKDQGFSRYGQDVPKNSEDVKDSELDGMSRNRKRFVMTKQSLNDARSRRGNERAYVSNVKSRRRAIGKNEELNSDENSQYGVVPSIRVESGENEVKEGKGQEATTRGGESKKNESYQHDTNLRMNEGNSTLEVTQQEPVSTTVRSEMSQTSQDGGNFEAGGETNGGNRIEGNEQTAAYKMPQNSADGEGLKTEGNKNTWKRNEQETESSNGHLQAAHTSHDGEGLKEQRELNSTNSKTETTENSQDGESLITTDGNSNSSSIEGDSQLEQLQSTPESEGVNANSSLGTAKDMIYEDDRSKQPENFQAREDNMSFPQDTTKLNTEKANHQLKGSQIRNVIREPEEPTSRSQIESDHSIKPEYMKRIYRRQNAKRRKPMPTGL